MNAHPDDFSMSDELRDLSRAYRDATKYEDGQEPSPALDAAILAAAHRAVTSKPQAVLPTRQQRRFFDHWRLPLSIAASFMVGVFVVMQFVAQKTEPEMPMLAQAPQVPQSSPEPEQPLPSQNSQFAQADAMKFYEVPAIADTSARSRSAAQSPRGAAKVQMAEASQPLESSALMAEAAPAVPSESIAEDMEFANAAKPMAAMRTMSAKRQNPQDWLEEIEKLHREGKIKEVRDSLAEFRKHYPDYELPKALRDLEFDSKAQPSR
jgi:Meckel syndrome type 1 protein